MSAQPSVTTGQKKENLDIENANQDTSPDLTDTKHYDGSNSAIRLKENSPDVFELSSYRDENGSANIAVSQFKQMDNVVTSTGKPMVIVQPKGGAPCSIEGCQETGQTICQAVVWNKKRGCQKNFCSLHIRTDISLIPTRKGEADATVCTDCEGEVRKSFKRARICFCVLGTSIPVILLSLVFMVFAVIYHGKETIISQPAEEQIGFKQSMAVATKLSAHGSEVNRASALFDQVSKNTEPTAVDALLNKGKKAIVRPAAQPQKTKMNHSVFNPTHENSHSKQKEFNTRKTLPVKTEGEHVNQMFGCTTKDGKPTECKEPSQGIMDKLKDLMFRKTINMTTHQNGGSSWSSSSSSVNTASVRDGSVSAGSQNQAQGGVKAQINTSGGQKIKFNSTPISTITVVQPAVKVITPKAFNKNTDIEVRRNTLCPDPNVECVLPGTSEKPKTVEKKVESLKAVEVKPVANLFVTSNENSANRKTQNDEIKCGSLKTDRCMVKKSHGTCRQRIGSGKQSFLRYGVSAVMACRISCDSREKIRITDASAAKVADLPYDREYKNYALEGTRTWVNSLYRNGSSQINYYDSQCGRLVFTAPVQRKQRDLLWESTTDGWPSFRFEEVNWDNVRLMPNSDEIVTLDGTHLGTRFHDSKGSRYRINLASIAGSPTQDTCRDNGITNQAPVTKTVNANDLENKVQGWRAPGGK